MSLTTDRRSSIRRKRRLALVAGAAVVAVTATAFTATPTLASWLDEEWAGAPVGVVDCAQADRLYTTTGEGQVLSGQLLGTDLDTIAEASGVTVTNDGTAASATPTSANPAEPAPDAWANPLTVEALSAIALDLGPALQLPLDNTTGALGQYALAQDDGVSTGASGLVTDNGAISTEPADGYPELATLDLKSLVTALDPTLADTLTDVAGISLETGAVGANATLDACGAAFDGVGGAEAAGAVADTEPAVALLSDSISADAATAIDSAATGAQTAVQRKYLAAAVDTTIESETVGSLVTAINGVVTGLETAVNGLASDQGVLDSVVGGVTDLVGGLLSQIGVAHTTVSLSAEIDLSVVTQLLDEPFGDAGDVLTISPGDSTIRVNTAALLEAAYPGQISDGLNGLEPNTNLLSDPAVLEKLSSVLGATLDDWLGEIQDLLTSALNLVDIRAVVFIGLLPILGGYTASVTATVDASLASLLTGGPPATVTTGGLLSVLRPIVGPLVSLLTGGLGLIVGNAVNTVLAPLATLGSTVTGLLQPIITLVSSLFDALYLNGVISITVNAQNDTPAVDDVEPPDWAALPDRRYDVAALRIGVLDALGENNIALYLGRASVGPNCLVGSTNC